MLLLTGAIVGVFCAQDLLVFYVFWEAMLIPLYLLVGVWGGAGRQRATLLFVIYTMAGSLLMLASIVVFGLSEGTFDLTQLRGQNDVFRLHRHRRQGARSSRSTADLRLTAGAGRGRAACSGVVSKAAHAAPL
jgi:NADH:ubiquinone oxidoreductase subunit 5 (subunit L)/multisubunit Na+/H+ antiporter MnhA subunit